MDPSCCNRWSLPPSNGYIYPTKQYYPASDYQVGQQNISSPDARSMNKTSHWVGIPLISNAPWRQRKDNKNFNKSGYSNGNRVHSQQSHFNKTVFSRLAVHTRGIPLTLQAPSSTATHKSNSDKNQTAGNEQRPFSTDYSETKHINDSGSQQTRCETTDPACADVLSSSNLPRIIKPRKRRKKDRKKINNALQSTDDLEDAIHSNIELRNNNVILDSVNEDRLVANADIENNHSTCNCRICDPFCEIWEVTSKISCNESSENRINSTFSPENNFPDQLQTTDSSPVSSSANNPIVENNEIKNNNNVGIIGSNRLLVQRNEWRPILDLSSISKRNDSSTLQSHPIDFCDPTISICDILNGLNLSTNIVHFNKLGHTSKSTNFSTADFTFETNNEHNNHNNNNSNNVNELFSTMFCRL